MINKKVFNTNFYSEFIEDVFSAQDVEQIGKISNIIIREFGFDEFDLFRFPTEKQHVFGELKLLSSFSSDLQTERDSEHVPGASPILTEMMRTKKPAILQHQMFRKHSEREGKRDEWPLFLGLGLNFGMLLSVVSTTGVRGVVCLYSNKKPRDDIDTLYLSLIFQYIFEKLIFLLNNFIPITKPLNKREKDSLKWCARGKSSYEIAIISGLSEHTVNHYIQNATQKLSAVNRTHAVALAIRAGLID